MAAIQVTIPPVCEPVSLVAMKQFLRVTFSDDDTLIQGLIGAARICAEEFTRRSFINKGYVQYLDSFPYFTDTLMSQMSYPPAYYSMPKYSTTLWNYSQMIKLFYSKLAAITKIRYVDSRTSTWVEMLGTTDMADATKDFLADGQSEPPRIFPKAGQYWPSVLYVPNAVEIHYTAGCNNDTAIAALVYDYEMTNPSTDPADVLEYEYGLRRADVPENIKTYIEMAVMTLYDNRGAINSQDDIKAALEHLEYLLWFERVLDLAPTRG